jgi:hypothetical protein
MNKMRVILSVIFVTVITLGMIVFISERSQAPTVYVINSETTQELPDLKVTYVLPRDTQKLYDIKVSSQLKSAEVPSNAVIVSGKACNNMTGSFIILGSNEPTDKPVLKTLKDGRKVLESATVSTMMSCIAVADPKFDDMALNKAIDDVGKSLESY